MAAIKVPLMRSRASRRAGYRSPEIALMLSTMLWMSATARTTFRLTYARSMNAPVWRFSSISTSVSRKLLLAERSFRNSVWFSLNLAS